MAKCLVISELLLIFAIFLSIAFPNRNVIFPLYYANSIGDFCFYFYPNS